MCILSLNAHSINKSVPATALPHTKESIQSELRRTPSAIMVRVLLDLAGGNGNGFAAAGSMPNAPGAVGLILAFVKVVALVGICKAVYNCACGTDNEPGGRGGSFPSSMYTPISTMAGDNGATSTMAASSMAVAASTCSGGGGGGSGGC